jgi:Transcriptional activator of glycolytic enzymes
MFLQSLKQQRWLSQIYPVYRMVKRHPSLVDMWDEWHGTGMFLDDLGGIEGRNKRFKAKWRKHFKGPQSQQYSQTKCIIESIRKYATNNQVKIEEALVIMVEAGASFLKLDQNESPLRRQRPAQKGQNARKAMQETTAEQCCRQRRRRRRRRFIE